MKRALVIGHRGQDGTLLCQFLSGLGYEVFGIGRSAVWSNTNTAIGAIPRITELEDVAQVVREVAPDEIYYLAAYHRSSQGYELSDPRMDYLHAHQTNVLGLINFLESIRLWTPSTRLFYASSSLIFSGTEHGMQNEVTSILPQGNYGITKAEGTWLCREYRQRHGVFASVGILYNHESHLRPPGFVSRKIIDGAIGIHRGQQQVLEIGNLTSVVDWSHAKDFVRAFHAILQSPMADEFVVSSGVAHSIKDFVNEAFATVGLDWRDKVTIKPDLITRASTTRIGDSSKLRRTTGWTPQYGFSDMIKEIVTVLEKT